MMRALVRGVGLEFKLIGPSSRWFQCCSARLCRWCYENSDGIACSRSRVVVRSRMNAHKIGSGYLSNVHSHFCIHCASSAQEAAKAIPRMGQICRALHSCPANAFFLQRMGALHEPVVVSCILLGND